MALDQKTYDWLGWVGTTSQQLFKLDENDRPAGFASGCVVDFNGRKILMSVSHATKVGKWAAEIQFDEARAHTELYFIGAQWTVALFDGQSTLKESLDFSFSEVSKDFSSVTQERDSRGRIVKTLQRHVFKDAWHGSPTVKEIYAFSGSVRHAVLDEATYWMEPNVYPGLRYEKTVGCYHVFKLPVEHPGHEAFRGCSGAPIIGLDKKIVALVCTGTEETNIVTGVSIDHVLLAVQRYLDGTGN